MSVNKMYAEYNRMSLQRMVIKREIVDLKRIGKLLKAQRIELLEKIKNVSNNEELKPLVKQLSKNQRKCKIYEKKTLDLKLKIDEFHNELDHIKRAFLANILEI